MSTGLGAESTKGLLWPAVSFDPPSRVERQRVGQRPNGAQRRRGRLGVSLAFRGALGPGGSFRVRKITERLGACRGCYSWVWGWGNPLPPRSASNQNTHGAPSQPLRTHSPPPHRNTPRPPSPRGPGPGCQGPPTGVLRRYDGRGTNGTSISAVGAGRRYGASGTDGTLEPETRYESAARTVRPARPGANGQRYGGEPGAAPRRGRARAPRPRQPTRTRTGQGVSRQATKCTSVCG